MIQMNIRRATLEDAPAIARVHVDSWRTTYKDILPASFLENLSLDQREKSWIHNLQQEDMFIWVVENEEGDLVGFATTNTRDSNKVSNATDLTSLYLLEGYQGYGLGRQLMETLFAHYEQQRYAQVFVEVLKDNKTKHFYEAFGAEFVEDVPLTIGGVTILESIYVWNLPVTEKEPTR